MVYQDLKFNRSQSIYLILNMLMVTGLCAAAITAGKIISIGTINFPCCNIIFSLLTFPLTDVIAEIWGKKYAARSVWIAFIAQAIFVFFIQISIVLPYPDFWTNQTSYASTLIVGKQLLFASMLAFISSQLWDVYIFCYIKKICNGKWLWLRNNLSTFSSQLINSSILITLLFWDSGQIINLLIGSIIVKWFIALLDTPLVYSLVYIIKRSIRHEQKLNYPSTTQVNLI